MRPAFQASLVYSRLHWDTYKQPKVTMQHCSSVCQSRCVWWGHDWQDVYMFKCWATFGGRRNWVWTRSGASSWSLPSLLQHHQTVFYTYRKKWQGTRWISSPANPSIRLNWHTLRDNEDVEFSCLANTIAIPWLGWKDHCGTQWDILLSMCICRNFKQTTTPAFKFALMPAQKVEYLPVTITEELVHEN